VKDSRFAITEAGRVPGCLFYCCGKVEPLNPFTFDMYSLQAGNIGDGSVSQTSPALCRVSIFPQDRGKFSFPVRAFTL
jgi:hypothetical protein